MWEVGVLWKSGERMGKGKCRRTVRGGRKGVGGYSSSEIEVCDIATENRTQMQSQVNRGCPLEESKNQFPVCFLALAQRWCAQKAVIESQLPSHCRMEARQRYPSQPRRVQQHLERIPTNKR